MIKDAAEILTFVCHCVIQGLWYENPEDMLATLKILANKKDVPYQSLAKVYLARQILLERASFEPAQKRKRGRKAHAAEEDTARQRQA